MREAEHLPKQLPEAMHLYRHTVQLREGEGKLAFHIMWDKHTRYRWHLVFQFPPGEKFSPHPLLLLISPSPAVNDPSQGETEDENK